MKISNKTKFVTGIALIVLGIGLILAFALRSPTNPITRTELDQLIQTKGFIEAQVIPTPYSGIYQVEGKQKLNGKRVSINTHLDEAQITSLSRQDGVKVQIPGEGMRGQWVSIVSTLMI